MLPLNTRVLLTNIFTAPFSGNPLKCDCRMLGFWEWLKEHPQLHLSDSLHAPASAHPFCTYPERLSGQDLNMLYPIDFCPAPMMTTLAAAEVSHSSVKLKWQVENSTLVERFVLSVQYTSQCSLTDNCGSNDTGDSLLLSSAKRAFLLTDLTPEREYQLCVTATGRYLRPLGKPTAYADVPHDSDLESNARKCLRVTTAARVHKRLMSLPELGIALGVGLGLGLIVFTSIIVTAVRLKRARRKKRRPIHEEDVPPEYISYRHFSIPGEDPGEPLS